MDELTKDFTAETSKVDEITILSDKAALAGKDGGIYKAATVGYQVLNQFGDDITKSVSLTANSSATSVTLSPSAHLITFTTNSANGFMMGRDVIVVSLLDTTTGKNASANLSLSMEAYAAEMTFAGVYNIDGKTLTEDTNFDNDPFYVLLTAKDQYGNKFNNYKQVTENKDLYLTVLGGMTALTKGGDGKTFIVLTKDGVDYLAYPLSWMSGMNPSSGTATVQVLSAGGGSCTGEIEISTGARVDTITVSQNGVIVGGEENELSYTALDADGKEVTAYKQLKDVEINGGNKCSLAFERNADGSAKLVLDAGNCHVSKDQTTMESFTFQTLNHKFSTALLTISEDARPVAFDGLRDVDTSFSNKTTAIDIKLKHLKIEDQYGRILPDWQVASMTEGSGIYQLKSVSASVVTNGVIQVSAAAVNATNTTASAIDGTATAKGDVIFQIMPGSNIVKGTEVVTFQIFNGATDPQNALADASANVNFTVKDTTAATTAVATVDPVYVCTKGAVDAVAEAYAQHVKVKVGGALLSRDDYTVSAPGGMTVTKGAIDGTAVWDVYSSDTQGDIKEFNDQTATTLTRTLTITLNGTGEKFTVDVTLDRTAPKITTVDGLTGKLTGLSSSNTINVANLFGSGASAPTKLSWDWIADQYGKGIKSTDANGVFTLADGTTFTPSLNFECTVPLGQGTGAPATLTNNNKSTAEMTFNAKFAGAGLTIDFGGTTATVKILAF